MARWLGLSPAKQRSLIDELGAKVPEITPTQEMRQERYDTWELTDDHGMLIFGIAKDQSAKSTTWLRTHGAKQASTKAFGI